MSESEESGVALQRKHSEEATREEIKAESVMVRLVDTFVCLACLFGLRPFTCYEAECCQAAVLVQLHVCVC